MTDKIKRGDLLPAWTVTLTDGGAAVNLTTASSITVKGYKPDGTTFSRAVTGDANGVITMAWLATDTENVGDLLTEVEVIWPGSKPQTFPADGYLVTRIYQDIG